MYNSHLLQIKNVPDTVLDRYSHSMNIIAISPSTMWVLVIGGLNGPLAIDSAEYASPVCVLIEMSE